MNNKNLYYICNMKKIRYWLYMLFKNKKHTVCEEGGFKITFREYNLQIETLSKNFSMKIGAGEYPFGYLVASLSQGKKDNIHGFAMYMYMVAMLLCRDKQFQRDLEIALKCYEKRAARKERMEKDDPVMEKVAIDTVKADEEVAHMSRRERRAHSRDFKKKAKEVLNETE